MTDVCVLSLMKKIRKEKIVIGEREKLENCKCTYNAKIGAAYI